MSGQEEQDGEDASALISELLKAAIEHHPRSVFERRALICRALAAIPQLRTDRHFDIDLDGKRSALRRVERVYEDIINAADDHVQAAMLIAGDLLDMFQPSAFGPLGRAFRERATIRTEKTEVSGKP